MSKAFIDFLESIVEMCIRDSIKREEGRTIGAVKEICGLLSLPEISRMEAFDISNISGFENVGSMVVYEKGKPDVYKRQLHGNLITTCLQKPA